MIQDETFNTVGDLYEKLSHDARLNPVGDDMTSVQTRDGLKKARDLVNRVIDQHVVTAAELANRTGIKQSAISAFRNDKWRGKHGTLVRNASLLSSAINILLLQRESDRTSVEGFVKTQVAETIFNMVKYAVKKRWIAGFTLPAGSGKTITLHALHEEIPGSVIITITHSAAAAKPFLQAWARALGTRHVGRTNDIQDGVIDCLTGSDRLVMIDEAHKLAIKSLDVMREVYDAAKVPIIIAGTPVLNKMIVSQPAGTMSCDIMDQLSSRIGLFKDLTDMVASGKDDGQLFSRDDIRKVFARGNVRISRDGIDSLFRLANFQGSGCLRTCSDMMQICVDMYKGEEITSDHLYKALCYKAGPRQAGFRMDSACGIAATHDTKAVASA